jgi:hypothetical protein
MDLPSDIIYNIYFYVDDYCTANYFWLLSKHFNIYYMTKYNRTYKHKFTILFNKLFLFLSLLPQTHKPIETLADVTFFELVTTQCLNKLDKKMLKTDISFIYYLYKTFVFNQLIMKCDDVISNINNEGTLNVDHVSGQGTLNVGTLNVDHVGRRGNEDRIMEDINMCNLLTNLIIVQGRYFLDRIISIKFDKNKITLQSNIKFQNLNILQRFHRGYDLQYIRSQIGLVENFFIDDS